MPPVQLKIIGKLVKGKGALAPRVQPAQHQAIRSRPLKAKTPDIQAYRDEHGQVWIEDAVTGASLAAEQVGKSTYRVEITPNHIVQYELKQMKGGLLVHRVEGYRKANQCVVVSEKTYAGEALIDLGAQELLNVPHEPKEVGSAKKKSSALKAPGELAPEEQLVTSGLTAGTGNDKILVKFAESEEALSGPVPQETTVVAAPVLGFGADVPEAAFVDESKKSKAAVSRKGDTSHAMDGGPGIVGSKQAKGLVNGPEQSADHAVPHLTTSLLRSGPSERFLTSGIALLGSGVALKHATPMTKQHGGDSSFEYPQHHEYLATRGPTLDLIALAMEQAGRQETAEGPAAHQVDPRNAGWSRRRGEPIADSMRLETGDLLKDHDIPFIVHDPLKEAAMPRVLPTPIMTIDAKATGPRADHVDIWEKKIREPFSGDHPDGQQHHSQSDHQGEQPSDAFDDEPTNPDISLQMMSEIA